MPSGRKFGAEMSADASVRRFVAARAKNSPRTVARRVIALTLPNQDTKQPRLPPVVRAAV